GGGAAVEGETRVRRELRESASQPQTRDARLWPGAGREVDGEDLGDQDGPGGWGYRGAGVGREVPAGGGGGQDQGGLGQAELFADAAGGAGAEREVGGSVSGDWGEPAGGVEPGGVGVEVGAA